MAREHAQIKLAIWDDDDFRDLRPAEQHLYFVLASAQSLSYCGVADWRPNRIGGLARGWTDDAVREAATGLIERLFILVDESTEEALLRSFVRHDGLMKNPRMAVAMARAHRAVASPILRGVVVHELIRLWADDPGLRGWEKPEALALLEKKPVDPTVYPLGMGLVKGSVMGSIKGSTNANPIPPVEGSVEGPPTPFSLLPAPSSLLPDSLRSSGTASGRKRPAHPIPDDWKSNDRHAAYALEHGLDVTHEAGQFRANAIANDRRYRDWDAAFRNWMGNTLKWDKPRHLAPVAAAPADGVGFVLPTPPREILDDPDTGAYLRWARAQRDAWQEAQS